MAIGILPNVEMVSESVLEIKALDTGVNDEAGVEWEIPILANACCGSVWVVIHRPLLYDCF